MAGRFRVLDLLGRGGMGEVYRVLDQATQRTRALKLVHRALLDSAEARERFRSEAALTQELVHERIVRTFDVGFEGERLFYTMELVEGGSIRARMETRRAECERGDREHAFDLGEALGLVDQVLEGLSYAHRRGIVHRDLKPENVLVTTEGAAKIADFGIAKVVDPVRLVSMSQVLGTPYYMAPEQLRPGAAIDARADLYAVGAILYELVADEVPVGRFDLPGAIRPNVPTEVDSLVARALSPKPDQRFADASEMRAALAAASKVVQAAEQARDTRWRKVESLCATAQAARAASRWDDALIALREAQSLAEDPTPIAATVAEVETEQREAIESRVRREREAKAGALLKNVEEARRERRWDDAIAALNEARDLIGDRAEIAEAVAALELQKRVVHATESRDARVRALEQDAGFARWNRRWDDAIRLLTEARTLAGDAPRIDRTIASVRADRQAALEAEARDGATLKGRLKAAMARRLDADLRRAARPRASKHDALASSQPDEWPQLDSGSTSSSDAEERWRSITGPLFERVRCPTDERGRRVLTLLSDAARERRAEHWENSLAVLWEARALADDPAPLDEAIAHVMTQQKASLGASTAAGTPRPSEVVHRVGVRGTVRAQPEQRLPLLLRPIGAPLAKLMFAVGLFALTALVALYLSDERGTSERRPRATVEATPSPPVESGLAQNLLITQPTEAEPSPPMPVPVVDSEAARVASLLGRGDALAAKQFFTTPGDNAIGTYRRVLALEPGNARAVEALAKIKDYFVAQAGERERKGDFTSAIESIDKALQATPDDISLAARRQSLDETLARTRATAPPPAPSSPVVVEPDSGAIASIAASDESAVVAAARARGDRFAVLGVGVVIDTSTNLMWANGNIEPIEWASANHYAEQLTLLGYSDWHLPTLEQLMTLHEGAGANRGESWDELRILNEKMDDHAPHNPGYETASGGGWGVEHGCGWFWNSGMEWNWVNLCLREARRSVGRFHVLAVRQRR